LAIVPFLELFTEVAIGKWPISTFYPFGQAEVFCEGRMSRKLLVLCVTFSFWFFSVSLADELTTLRRLEIPSLGEFGEKRFDLEKSEVLGWIQDIETVLLTETHDYSVRSEINEEMLDGHGRLVLGAWSHSFRQAKHPETDSHRLISVRQSLLDNAVIATNTGVARDNREHLDIVCKSQRCECTRLTAYETHISEQIGEEYDWKDQIEELRLMDIFDPCAAATVSSHQTSDGYAMDFSRHNFRVHSIRGVIQRGDHVHVLLRFKGSSHECHIATFREKVPLQVCGLEWVGDDESKAKVVSVTRSEWIAPKGIKQKLPVKIHAVSTEGGLPSELLASIEWRMGDDVDLKLFDRSTLGFRNPVPDSDFGIPLLLR